MYWDVGEVKDAGDIVAVATPQHGSFVCDNSERKTLLTDDAKMYF